MKKILIILVILQGVLLSAVVETIEVKKTKIPFIFEKDSTLPIASMQIIFQNSGCIVDNDKAGLSKFSASMLNEGTKKLGSTKFALKLEENAVSLSSHSGTETFVVEVSSLKEKFKDAVGFVKELLSDPNFTKESFEKIKLLKSAYLKKKEADFDYIASLERKRLMYANTPLKEASIGTYESIGKLKLEDIVDFYKNHFVLSRAIVVVGGDLDIDEAKKFAIESISMLEVGQNEPLKFFQASEKSEFKETYKDTQQAFVYFGSPYDMNVGDPKIYISRVASFILGAGGFGSRMMEEIRVKRGLAYSAYSRVNITKSHSDFTGYLQTKLESQDEAIKLVKELIKEFVKNGVTQDELDQTKKFLLGSEPLRVETLSQRLSRAFMDYYNGYEIGHSKDELKKIEALKLDELNQFIKEHDEINKLTFSVVTKK